MKKVIVVAAIVGLCLAGLAACEVFAQVVPVPPVPAPPVPAPPAPVPGTWAPPPQVQVPGGPDASRRGAVILSAIMPGTGEWLNRNFEGPFPTVECALGCVCPFVMFSSVLDAAAGDRSEKVRLDFWTKPVAEQ